MQLLIRNKKSQASLTLLLNSNLKWWYPKVFFYLFHCVPSTHHFGFCERNKFEMELAIHYELETRTEDVHESTRNNDMIYTTDIWDDKTMKILVVQRTGAFFARRPIVSNFISTQRLFVAFFYLYVWCTVLWCDRMKKAMAGDFLFWNNLSVGFKYHLIVNTR